MYDEISSIDNKSGKYIYKITNIINGKCYIGQAKDYKVRFQGHKLQLRKNEHENQHLQYAWNKYGEDAFTFEVLEFAEDYNEREKYYIKLYNSTDEAYGYNILDGGENPPVGAHATLSLDDVKQIQNMFLDGCELNDICSKFPYVTRGQINKINVGKAWHDESLNYPLKKDNDNEIGIDIANSIIYDLLYTTITQREIAKKHGVSRTCVTAINNGDIQKYYNASYTYPLRRSTHYHKICDNIELLNSVIFDIKCSDLSFLSIAKKYELEHWVIKSINRGKGRYHVDGVDYPIRIKQTIQN